MVELPENPRWLPHCVTYISAGSFKHMQDHKTSLPGKFEVAV